MTPDIMVEFMDKLGHYGRADVDPLIVTHNWEGRLLLKDMSIDLL